MTVFSMVAIVTKAGRKSGGGGDNDMNQWR